MYYAYILKSKKDGKYYYGHSKDIKLRLTYHNAGKVRFTKSRRLWNLHYYEKYETRSEAVKREMFFKSIDGYNWLKNRGII